MNYPVQITSRRASISRVAIVDGYVDEPACFGVPPYISPYIRYCAGVGLMLGAEVEAFTCDEWRADRARWDDVIARADVTVVIMGMTVPGRYRGGSPLTLRELGEISASRRRGSLILGGPVAAGYALRGGAHATRSFPSGIDLVASADVAASLERYMMIGELDGSAAQTSGSAGSYAAAGAQICRSRVGWPDIIAEIELSSGCDRYGARCSFCTEGLVRYKERSAEEIADEVRALSSVGARAFRLGRCANILAWGGAREEGGVKPNARAMRELYGMIRSAAPDLEVLHTDNCNPATIARWPDESAETIAAISDLGTEGDGLSLGLESLDPDVIRANSLKVDEDGAHLAVRMINEIGRGRSGSPAGLPSILPGLNFLYGLAGESAQTPKMNTRFLRRLLDDGLIVRRINIRRAMLFDDTALPRIIGEMARAPRLKERDLRRWKEWVRSEVDPEMMERVAPDGTLLRGVIAEEREGGVIFGRQLGSYPPLVGIVSPTVSPGEKLDVMVCGRGGRSLTGVRYPLDINVCSSRELEALPGIGRARAAALIGGRPYRSHDDIKRALGSLDARGMVETAGIFFGVR